MRGRASGLGARISSMVLLIFVGNRLVERVVGEVHRADYLLDEFDLTDRESIFRVEILIRPLLSPLLGRHEGVDLACHVLGWLVQQNQKTSQPTEEVGQSAFGLTLRVERANAEIRFRRNAPGFSNEWRADDPMRVGVFVSSPRCGVATEQFPLADEFSTGRDRASTYVSRAAVLIDQHITGTLRCLALERCL